jgi:hypothetical protein
MKTPEEITKGIRERFYNLLPADKSNPLYTAIANAIRAEGEELERIKQGVQQIVPLGAVDQIVRQQEEIDRLRELTNECEPINRSNKRPSGIEPCTGTAEHRGECAASVP